MAIQGGNVVWQIDGNAEPLKRALHSASDSVRKSMKDVGQSMVKVGAGMTAAGAAITGALGFAVKGAMDFGTAMAEVNTLGVKDLGAIGDAIKDVSMEFGIGLVDGAKAAYQAISAGVKEAQVPLMLAEAAKAATAGVSDLTTAVDLGTNVANAFGVSYDKIGGIFDQSFVAVKLGKTNFNELASSVGKLAPTFVAAGLSSEEMFGAIAALTTGGIATAEAVTYLRSVVAAFQRQGQTAVLDTLGLAGALQWLKVQTKGNDQEMLKFLGSTEAMTGVLSLTGGQAQIYADIMKAMGSSTGATQEAFDKFTESDPAFAWRQLSATLQVLRIEIGQALLPVLARIVEFIKPIVLQLVAWVKENKSITSGITLVVAGIGVLLTVLGPIVGALGVFLIIMAKVSLVALGVAAAVGAGAAGAFLLLRNHIAAVVSWARANWDRLVALFTAGAQVLGNLMKALLHFWEAILIAVGAVLSTFLGEADRFWADLTGGAKDGGGDWLEQLTRLAQLTERATRWMAKNMGQFADRVREYWNIIAFAAKVAFAVWDSTAGNLIRIIAYLGGWLQWLFEKAMQAMQALGFFGVGGGQSAMRGSAVSGVSRAAAGGGGGGGVTNNVGGLTVNLTTPPGADGRSIAQAVARELPRVLGEELRLRAGQRGMAWGV